MLEPNSSTEEWIDEHALTVVGWAHAHVAEYEDIEKARANREGNSLIGGCAAVGAGQGLYPFVEKVKESLNSNVDASEWVLIEVIADSGACETVMPKSLCGNIRLRESAGSKAGV